ncbi:hypothetical protein FBZ83_103113 [Azospirillum brasilense]|uniref:Uncharacterized protein n=1 Tax=Azospirillum brasilense TaxID=192 RepID=A0A560CKW7_AZOBR|nr:hypothetical protein [Azospirillum brasilense]MBK3733442.1 hypothetical protein [Azospirillum brasilense]TWA85522.1 hypothetical protein FBZ83_103113 [Azospirillum brasilense]
MTDTSSTRNPQAPIRADWWSKSVAGVVLGFALAIALSGLFAWIGPGGPAAVNKLQFVMWLVVPIWLGVVSLCFLFRSGRQAWLWLGGATVLAHTALLAARSPLLN